MRHVNEEKSRLAVVAHSLYGVTGIFAVLTISIVGIIALMPATTSATTPSIDYRGKVITGSDGLYFYVGYDDKRYTMPRPGVPNQPAGDYNVYSSWYSGSNQVIPVTDDELRSRALGGTATLRPGTKLVKIASDPKIYAVEPGGVLRYIEGDTTSTALYGTDWQSRVVVVPDVYFINYTIGSPNITSSTIRHPDGTLIQYAGYNDIYLISNGQKRHFVGTGFSANRYSTQNVVTNVNQFTFPYTNGADISVEEPGLTTIAG